MHFNTTFDFLTQITTRIDNQAAVSAKHFSFKYVLVFFTGYFFIFAMTKVNPGLLLDFCFPGFIIIFTVPCKKTQPFSQQEF